MKTHAAIIQVSVLVLVNTILALPTVAASGSVLAWGHSTVPEGLTNITAIAGGVTTAPVAGGAGGAHYSLAIQTDGTVVAWGRYSTFWPADVPPGLSNVVAIAGGGTHRLALKANGTVTVWDRGTNVLANVFPAASNIVAVAAGLDHDLILRSDGTVLGWGSFAYYGQANVPEGLSGVVAIAAGYHHSLALQSDGTVKAWGYNAYGQSSVPPDLTDVIAIAAGGHHSLALRSDGTIVGWGENAWDCVAGPSKATGMIAISTGAAHTLALDSSGNVHTWGGYSYLGEATAPSGMQNAIAIASGSQHSLAIVNDGSPVIVRQPLGRTTYTGNTVTLSVGAAGTPPMTYQWRHNGTSIPEATNASLTLINLRALDAGDYDVVVSNAKGMLASTPAALTVTHSAPVILEHPLAQPVVVGSNVTLRAKVAGSSPMNYQWLLDGNPVADGTALTLQVTEARMIDEGYYRLAVSNEYAVVTSSDAFLDVVDLADALDATNLTWTTGGDVSWLPRIVSWGNDHFIHGFSGGQPGGLNSFLETTITGPGILTFNWMVYCRADADYLNFAIDGEERLKISGSVGWERQTFYFGEGPRTLRWSYLQAPANDLYGSAGLDEVTFLPQPTPPVVLKPPADQTQAEASSVRFDVSTGGAAPFSFQWQFNGTDIPGATAKSLTLTNLQPTDAGRYRVVVSNVYGTAGSPEATLTVADSIIVAWGGLANVPPELTNVVSVASGSYHNLALKNDRTLAIWTFPNNVHVGTNIPPGLTNIIAIAAGDGHNLALDENGTVVAWDSNSGEQTYVPPLTDVVAIAAGGHNMALKSDGTIVGWGGYYATEIPDGLTNVVAIAAGRSHGLALKSDGTVVAWGAGSDGPSKVPSGLSNVVAIAAGYTHSLALKSDGTVAAWGHSYLGYAPVAPPEGLSNVVAIAAGGAYSGSHSLALKNDGTIVAWGADTHGQTTAPAEVTDVTAIAAGGYHSVAIKGKLGLPVPAYFSNPLKGPGMFTVSIPTHYGQVYALEYNESLESDDWTALPLTAGNGSVKTLVDVTADQSKRFYRVRRW